MKKNVLISALMALLLLSCSGNGEKAVRDYALQFAKAVSSGDSSSVVKMYPDAALADSLALSFVEDSLKIESNEKGDSILIHYTSDIWVRALKDENDSIRIVSSKGLFAYPADQLAFAKSTGQYADSLEDKGNAERMADKFFLNSLADKLTSSLKSGLKATCRVVSTNFTTGVSTYSVTIRNDNDFDVPADAYSFVLAEKYFDTDLERDVVSGYKTIDGVEVKAKSTATRPVPGKYDFEYSSLSASVKINYSKEQAVSKLLKPTGHEYEEYLATKQDDTSVEASSVEQRVDLSMHGTISTISNVSFVMNGTKGVLEYVMDGNSVVSELRFGALRPDGTLTVKSYTPEGKQKGTFNGKLTTTNGSKQYKGQFTNVKGGSTTFSFTE